MAGAHPRLAGRRPDEPRRPRCRRASVGGGLSGRCAMDRRRGVEELVRAGEIAPVVPPDPGRDVAGPGAGAGLHQPRLLSDPATIKAALIAQARAQGFGIVGVARPDSIPEAKQHLETFLADGAHGDMEWLAANAERRGDPRTLWSEVRSVI